MPTLSQRECTAKELKTKKTKSRNGCGRCKLKRLKCDETAPNCLQCCKRNVACPGYKRTLKWSTKYEVFDPTQPELPSSGSATSLNTTTRTCQTADQSLPQNVVTGIEALAAVLPVRKRNPASEEEDQAKRAAQSNSSPPGFDRVAREPSPEDGGSPRELASFVLDDIDLVDPVIFDGLIDVETFPQDQIDLHTLHDLEFDAGILNDVVFDPKDDAQQEDMTLALPLISSSLIAESAAEGTFPSSPRLSRSLLLDFYRLPTPSPDALSHAIESLLLQHYFKDVCALFSTFDSIANPFRTTISRTYEESPSIKYAIQSMAAAHLANTFPNMAAVGAELRRKADTALKAELPLAQSGQANVTKTFLTIVMLGLTASWHNSTDLGIDYLTTARSLILPKLLSRSAGTEPQRETQFFEECLIHWEMLMGFVSEDSISFSTPSGLRTTRISKQLTPPACQPDKKIIPHPWTGISPMFQFLFAEVGRLVRKDCFLNRDSMLDLKRREENLHDAITLEEDFLAVEHPPIEKIAHTGDERTPTEHFSIIAEAYRYAGLLELYRVFPCILRKRLESGTFHGIEGSEFVFSPLRYDTIYEENDIKLWLNTLAMHILRSIESIPPSSGTFCVQPLLLVVAACELRFISTLDFFDVRANDAQVNLARDFVIRRLQEYALRMPNKPMLQMIQLVKETWQQSDTGRDTFWMDIMDEKGWHTTM